jgi:lycopene cyclase domain-containing protein
MGTEDMSKYWYRSSSTRWLFPVLALFIVVLHWRFTDVHAGQLLFEVERLGSVAFFESRYLYAFAHLFALIPVLALSFDRKVAYYREWKYLLPALFMVAIPYWIWDVAKTEAGVWGFNPKYYSFLILNLPVEEWLFFISFPFASVFIYCCLNAWLPETAFLNWLQRTEKYITTALILLFLGVGLLHWGKAYTVTSFWIAGFLLLWQRLYGTKNLRVLFYRLLPLATFAFVVVNSVFTGSFTAQPIVVYNPEEYLGIRFLTIPLDDFSYNFGLQLAVICLYEWFKNRRF